MPESTPSCDCPPPAQRLPDAPPDPRAELLRIASVLAQRRDPRLLADYLRLRRAAR